MSLVEVARRLSDKMESCSFEPPVEFSYNPLKYAAKSSESYLNKFGAGKKKVLLLGMNPGPFGMAQTGVPFGDVGMVRDWMGISEVVGKPSAEHPKRPVDGFSCSRGEVSGQRLWGWAKDRFKRPENFFKNYFVWNYCPLCFMEKSGRNLTPDKLPAETTKELYRICDQALREVVAQTQPQYVIGVGNFALQRIKTSLSEVAGIEIGKILHPSPASPAANRGWAEQIEKQLEAIGIENKRGPTPCRRSTSFLTY